MCERFRKFLLCMLVLELGVQLHSFHIILVFLRAFFCMVICCICVTRHYLYFLCVLNMVVLMKLSNGEQISITS